MDLPPLLANKHTDSPSVFIPSTLLLEARRQKGIAAAAVPPVCILDPDGDLVRRLTSQAPRGVFQDWPCYTPFTPEFEIWRGGLRGSYL